MTREIPVSFTCENDWLYGILHLPETPVTRGVLIIVGGPQYRVGSHRQFLLLARALSDAAIPVMRFDYRGMGDSDGEFRTFEKINADIRAAIDLFFEQMPVLREIVLWGLCDAASAELFYAHTDHRVTGLVLLNPWVRTDEGIAKAYLKRYYLARFVQADLWKKIIRGEFDFAAATRSFLGTVFASMGLSKGGTAEPDPDVPSAENIARESATGPETEPLPIRMLDGLTKYKGRVLLILSGDDLTAGEFKDTVANSRRWRKLLQAKRVTRQDLPGANHTFSRREWRDQVAVWTQEWTKSW
jgi:exosortase A-associated hydrolase 1